MNCILYNATSSETIKRLAKEATGDCTLLYIKDTEVVWGYLAQERMKQVMDATGAAMVYADRYVIKNGQREQAPVIDYQMGSLRDDFDFGAVVMIRTSALKEAASRMQANYRYAGFYDLRLKLSQRYEFVHINEYLYYELEGDARDSGVKIFDYVNPRNREVQIEMEKVCTGHLKAVGAYLEPVFKEIDLSEGEFEYEASVIIPCKNRVRTIGDAIRSALNQKTTFKYNVIVVDDNSDDGTAEVIKSFLADERVVYIAQDRSYHAIGGNWNAALHHPRCGRFALQLDSDDIYSDGNTVQKFVDAFYEQKCPMVVGTYKITDFDLDTIPPGVIDHREWTEDNGRNNALRVNGLGAPRGFFVPLLRKLNFPVTKYGEDYAVGLRVSRDYRIGRIYDVLYFCRRWDGNSDHGLSRERRTRTIFTRTASVHGNFRPGRIDKYILLFSRNAPKIDYICRPYLPGMFWF